MRRCCLSVSAARVSVRITACIAYIFRAVRRSPLTDAILQADLLSVCYCHQHQRCTLHSTQAGSAVLPRPLTGWNVHVRRTFCFVFNSFYYRSNAVHNRSTDLSDAVVRSTVLLFLLSCSTFYSPTCARPYYLVLCCMSFRLQVLLPR